MISEQCTWTHYVHERSHFSRQHKNFQEKLSFYPYLKFRQLGSPNRFVFVNSNSDDDFCTIGNPTTNLSRRSQFLYNFDLFLIKINQFQSIFDFLIKIRWKWSTKRLKFLIKRSKLLIKRSKILKLIEKVDIFQLFWYISNNFNIKLISFDPFQNFQLIQNRFNQFRRDDWFWLLEFRLKMSIKKQFDYD